MPIRPRTRSRAVALVAATAALVGTALTTPVGPAHAAPAAQPDCPWVGSSAPINQRVADVVAQMTLDEKITMVHGASGSVYTGYIPGNKRLCIPALKLQDGPVGVRMDNTTQLPSGADLAASFDTSTAQDYGSVIGAEDKTKGVDVDLGPTINIVRDPRWGRAFESYSEDPYLTGQIGSADINGIQSKGVMAQVKHYAVYNQETNRNTPADDVIVDDRTVREIYTAAFGTIVREANPSSMMCSYSTINGQYACQNAYLDGILKNEFGFQGFITSDWGATHSTVASANAGMDMQMPDDSYFGAPLKHAVLNGRVPVTRLNDMVSRILREEFRFGLFEHPSPDTYNAYASTPGHAAIARKAAEQGAVLLKNSPQILPIDTHTVRSIAVIGDGAGKDTMSAGGGSATVAGTGTVTPYNGIKSRAGSAIQVRYSQGNIGENTYPIIDTSNFTPPSGTGNGLQGEYFSNMNLSGTPTLTRTDPTINFNWGNGSPGSGLPDDHFSARWTGTLTPPATGTYTFGLTSDDGSRLFINGKQIINNWRDQAPTTETGTVDLTAGHPVNIKVEYYEDGGGAEVSLGWLTPNSSLLTKAVNLAKNSDLAIVYANKFESEGGDLTDINLPTDQNQLISAVAKANPNTVVVLNTGSAVTMPWLSKVRGVIEAWYPGQESGNAIAALLFGDVNPSGKLPVTFPASLKQVPASTKQQWPGVKGKVYYSEGLDVGYRWYDTQHIAPLFPFGYGLSYTTFQFSDLQVSQPTLSPDGSVTVSARVTNTGDRAGAEVAQLYLTDPASTGEPGRQLKGFDKVSLAPGASSVVHFVLKPRDAAYWNTANQQWTMQGGTYQVQVGDSSQALPLVGSFSVASTAPVG